ncbi:SRPBCC family protein [Phenylobacterium sp.]|uniref:SRPBCC family protein n=1 Tax=Phenylobacterium sp. TaxID=1871053 RepID=UPI00289DE7F0|nr:SRPBCC family protein [Phenylobacterium sp.]
MTSASHTSFVIERRFAAPPAAVFGAWADIEAKRRWSDCHTDEGQTELTMDFRPGGRESYRAVLEGGVRQSVEKVFFDIVWNERIVFAYDIEVGGKRLSASLVTVEFSAEGEATFMRLTEQLAYFDGHDDLQERIRGTREGLDRLALDLETGGAPH